MCPTPIFKEAKSAAVMKLALLTLAIDRRLPPKVAALICGRGMELVDAAEQATTYAEWAEHLPKLHNFFQTNLNNLYPRQEDMKRYFREEGIDMGFDYPIW